MLLATNFEVQMENRKVEGLIVYSTHQPIFKFTVDSASDPDIWGVYVDFKSNQNKSTIHGILQHMGCYPPNKNPNVMMRENLKTKSSEYIIIYHDELYNASATPQEILHMLQDKYKINIFLEFNFPHDPGGRNIYQIKKYLEKVYANVNILFKHILPQDLYISS